MSDTSTHHPHITVAAIIEKENRFLVVKEKEDGRILYNQPAGHLRPRETILEALHREVLKKPVGLQKSLVSSGFINTTVP
ncbi:MAG: NUDIX domain-containing protein [Gammaproteobacteria bacterium]|nr:NUDIX domain-containing protein [Gammaproteobacteria bacterium]